MEFDKSYFIKNQVKLCNTCKEILTLDSFGPRKRGFLGVKAVCKKCLNEEEKERYKNNDYKDKRNSNVNKWRRENKERWSEINLKNKEARRLQKARRRAYKLALPCHFISTEFHKIKTNDYDQDTFEIDHFIPLSWGHGGTYSENLCVLPKIMNASKSDTNPFDFYKTLSGSEKVCFGKIIKRIADQYHLSVVQLKQFVNWCENNKRSLEDIKKDGNVSSYELWKRVNKLIMITGTGHSRE